MMSLEEITDRFWDRDESLIDHVLAMQVTMERQAAIIRYLVCKDTAFAMSEPEGLREIVEEIEQTPRGRMEY